MNREKTTANSTFAISGVSCSAVSLVVAESFVLRINIGVKIPSIANLPTGNGNCRTLKYYLKTNKVDFVAKNRLRFDSIHSDKRFNFLETIYSRLANNDADLNDTEILENYFKFSDNIQTNTFAAAELEWVTISILCYHRPHLTETLIRRGLLCIVYSLGDSINNEIIFEFIKQRILATNSEPYGGLPPQTGQKWLIEQILTQSDLIERTLQDVIKKNNEELEGM